MIIENTDIYGIRYALRSMRNSQDNNDESDSIIPKREDCVILGKQDKELSQLLVKSNNIKHLKMIQVWADLILLNNIKCTINSNYNQLLEIYQEKNNENTEEWHIICDWILGLMLFKELTGVEVCDG